jgi:sugar/nucleoside kinase (ribokinase family)
MNHEFKQKMNIVVLGSINIDTFLTVERQPQVGETIKASSMKQGFGGKVSK